LCPVLTVLPTSSLAHQTMGRGRANKCQATKAMTDKGITMKIQTTNAYVFKNTRSPLQTNAGKRAGVPSSLKLALVTVLSATVLSGCLMEGDVSGSKSRSKLMQELHTTYLAENAAQLEQNGGREVGATGGTGTAIESANLEASTANTGSSVSNNSTETSVPSTGALTTAPETTPETRYTAERPLPWNK